MKIVRLPQTEGEDIIYLLCEGFISQRNFPPGKDPLSEALGDDGYGRKVLLNLERTYNIDTSGVSWLLNRHREFEKVGGSMALCSVPPMVHQMLDVLHLSPMLHVVSDEQSGENVLKSEACATEMSAS
jgi:anti-anti-sigma factor